MNMLSDNEWLWMYLYFEVLYCNAAVTSAVLVNNLGVETNSLFMHGTFMHGTSS